MHLCYGRSMHVGHPSLEFWGSPLNAVLWAMNGSFARVWEACLVIVGYDLKTRIELPI